MRRLLQRYESVIRANLIGSSENDDRDLSFWQDQLFSNFLVYGIPISLIALVPGVILSFKNNLLSVAAVDLIIFTIVILATITPNIKLRYRKACVITVFYILAIFLINKLGYFGPGVFYLFFCNGSSCSHISYPVCLPFDRSQCSFIISLCIYHLF